jgi:hypothetical protein
MSTKQFSLTVVVLALSACPLPAAVVNSRWDGGPEGQWNDAKCWSPCIVPDNTVWSTYAVLIDVSGSRVQVGLGEKHTVDRLVCRGDVTIYGPWYPINLTLIKGLINYGDLYTARIDYVGDVTNASGARLRWAEFVSVHGNLSNEPNATLEVTDQEMEIIDANVVNRGLIRAYRNGGLDAGLAFQNFGRIELMNGMVNGHEFHNANVGLVEGAGSIQSDRLIRNAGVIQAICGALNLFSDGSIVNAGTLGNKPLAALTVWSWGPEKVSNQGTIQVNAGGGVAVYEELVNEPNGVVELLGGTLAATTITQKAGATLRGFGRITGNVVIEPNAIIKLTGPTSIVGDVTIGAGATLDISDGTVLVTGLTTCNGGTIRTKGGAIITQGGMSGGVCRREIVDIVQP